MIVFLYKETSLVFLQLKVNFTLANLFFSFCHKQKKYTKRVSKCLLI